MARPDAIIFTRGGQVSMLPESNESVDNIVGFADKHLQTSELELARVRAQPGEFFATRDPSDTLNYPLGHSREGRPRYRWEDQGNGLKYGYLLETQ